MVAKNLMAEKKLDGALQATLKYIVGQKLEKKDHSDPAMELYNSALKNNPNDQEIKKRLESVQATMSSILRVRNERPVPSR